MSASFSSVLLFFLSLAQMAMAVPFLLVDGSPPGLPYVNIQDNAATSTIAGTSFPDVKVGEVQRHRIRLRNIGSSILTYSISDDSNQFRAISPGSVLVPTTGVREFEIEFAPNSAGVRTAVMTISSNDPNRESFEINLQGRGIAPEISVVGGTLLNVNIADGDTTPRTTDGTDFGSRDVFDGPVLKNFRIRNSGDAPLQFVSGSVTAGRGFSISSLPAPASLIGAGEQWTFILSYDPAAIGATIATVTLLTDDANEGQFTFNVRGTGTVTPDIAVRGKPGGSPLMPIASGSTTPQTTNGTDFGSRTLGGIVRHGFEIKNEGTALLTFQATSSDTQFEIVKLGVDRLSPDGLEPFCIDFKPVRSGPQTATIRIDSNDPDEDPYTFVVRGTGTAPEITVLGDTDFSEVILDGDTTPRVGDGTNFLDVDVTGGLVRKTFRIKNDGNEVLTFVGANITPQTGFFLADLPSATFPIPPFGSVEFDVGFNPFTDGPSTATVTITSNDANESPYTFRVTGNGVGEPNAVVYGNYTSLQSPGQFIEPGSLLPTFEQDTLFGEVVLGETRSGRFAVRNSGDGTLDYTVGLIGSQFRLVADGTTLEPNGGGPSDDDFLVIFEPTSRGTKTAVVTVTSNDPDTPSYSFVVEGKAVDPEIDIFGGETLNVPVLAGATSSSSTNGTSYGSAVVDASGEVRTFLIFNSGERDLVIAGDALSNEVDFTLTGLPGSANPIEPNTSAEFQLVFEPQSAGRKSTTVTIFSNDDDENPYTFVLTGTGLNGPEFNLFGGDPLVEIESGDTTPSAMDGTDFGLVEVGVSLDRVFTIRNEGNEHLDFGNGGITAGQVFSLGKLPLVLGSANETHLTITFLPTTEGAATATVSIPSNDSDEDPYTFVVSGMGIAGEDPPSAEVVSGTGQIIVSGSANTTTAAGTYFVTVTEGEPLAASFVLRNTGGSELAVISRSGAVITGLGGTVEAEGEVPFTITLPSATAGLKEATIQIETDDPSQPTYSFLVRGIVLPERGAEMSSLELVGTSAVVTYPTAPGLVYRFSTSTTMAEGSWSSGGMVLGTGLVRTFTINNFIQSGEPRRFLRVEIVGPDDL